MLDSVLKLIDYFVKVVEFRERRNERFFDRVVTPTYQLGKKVFQDYLKVLDGIRERIEGGEGPENLIRFIERGRLEYLPARIELRATLRRTDFSFVNADDFTRGIRGILCGGLSTYEEWQLDGRWTGRGYAQTGHTLLDVLYHFRILDGQKPLKEKLLEFVSIQEDAIKAAWQDAASGYAEMQSQTAKFGEIRIPAGMQAKRRR